MNPYDDALALATKIANGSLVEPQSVILTLSPSVVVSVQKSDVKLMYLNPKSGLWRTLPLRASERALIAAWAKKVMWK